MTERCISEILRNTPLICSLHKISVVMSSLLFLTHMHIAVIYSCQRVLSSPPPPHPPRKNENGYRENDCIVDFPDLIEPRFPIVSPSPPIPTHTQRKMGNNIIWYNCWSFSEKKGHVLRNTVHTQMHPTENGLR